MTELETKLLGALKDAREHINQDWYSVESQCEMLSHLDDCIAAAEAAQQVGDIDVVELANKSYMDGVNDGIEAEREAIIRKLLELGALEDGAYIEAIRARGNKH